MDKQANWIDPDDAKAHYNLGNAYFESGKHKESIEPYKQVMRIKSLFPVFDKSASYLCEEEARSDLNRLCKQAIRINPLS